MEKVIDKSLLGKAWFKGAADDTLVSAAISNFNLPEPALRLLVSRGVDDIEGFLNPTLSRHLPDPDVITDMDAAATAAAASIMSDDVIAIFGDYDVDGITSTAIMVKYLNAIGLSGRVIWRLPNRDEGYGLNKIAIDEFADAGVNLIISVDCGISAKDEVEYANNLGMKVIITDHHNAEGKDLPRALAVVDPKRGDDTSGLNYLAGVGVAFMFLIALNRKLRKAGFFAKNPEPELKELLDLVALGTICDTMPLVGLNRALVSAGLKVANLWKNTGLKVLAEVAGCKVMDVYAAGFMLGPRLNASGRLGSADDSLRLLLTDNPQDARAFSNRLDAMNAERKGIESGILMLADEMIEHDASANKNCIFVCGDNWHGGVMGIIAGRLKEKYYRPVCVATIKDGIANGSGRSVPEIDLGGIIENAKNAGILIEGGGHAVAAGFSLKSENIPAFRQYLDDAVAAQLQGASFSPRLEADLEMDASAANMALVRSFAALAPFGQNNPEPSVILTGAVFDWAEPVGNGHLKIGFLTSTGRLSAIGFGMLRNNVGEFFMNETNRGRKVDLFGKLKENTYNGNSSVQLVLEDVHV